MLCAIVVERLSNSDGSSLARQLPVQDAGRGAATFGVCRRSLFGGKVYRRSEWRPFGGEVRHSPCVYSLVNYTHRECIKCILKSFYAAKLARYRPSQFSGMGRAKEKIAP